MLTLDRKRHLTSLDGLRGVAALAVFAFHLTVYNGFKVLSYAPLAVDFFFILSGFVIALAYEDKIRTSMTALQFFRLRFIRLYPMIFAGMAIGFCITVGRSIIVGDISGAQLIQIGLSSLALLPCYAVAQYMEAFPANAPMWSLFFEVLANIIYVLVLARASNRTLYALAAASGVALIVVTFQLGTLLHGFDKSYLYVGLLRVAFSFTVGVILFRHRDLIPRASNFALPIVGLLCTILMWPGDALPAIELTAVIFGFPVIVALASTVQAGALWVRPCSIIGALSYPLYAIHAPVIRAGEVVRDKLAPNAPAILVVLVEASAAIAVTYALIVLYDTPVRRWLSKTQRRSSQYPVRPISEQIVLK